MAEPRNATCDRCGRVGERGFYIQIRLHPLPNRILCNNYVACERRRKALVGSRG
jgi:hypothetical protein